MSESLDNFLTSTQADVAAAAAALAEAEARVAAAEAARQRALEEDEERRRRDEDARIEELRSELPRYRQFAADAMADFKATAAGDAARPVADCLASWGIVARYRALCNRMRALVLAHDAARSIEFHSMWERKSESWAEMIRGATCVPHGGYLAGEQDDSEALAAVNARIVEESAAAPRPLERDPLDRSEPGPDALGIPNPLHARMAQMYDTERFAPLSFAAVFDEAVSEVAERVAREFLPSPTPAASVEPQPPSPAPSEQQRPLTRDEKVALQLAAALGRGR